MVYSNFTDLLKALGIEGSFVKIFQRSAEEYLREYGDHKELIPNLLSDLQVTYTALEVRDSGEIFITNPSVNTVKLAKITS